MLCLIEQWVNLTMAVDNVQSCGAARWTVGVVDLLHVFSIVSNKKKAREVWNWKEQKKETWKGLKSFFLIAPLPPLLKLH